MKSVLEKEGKIFTENVEKFYDGNFDSHVFFAGLHVKLDLDVIILNCFGCFLTLKACPLGSFEVGK